MLTDAIFIPGSPLCASSYELQAKNKRQKKKKAVSIRECEQLLLRERSCPGGLGCVDPAAVLHWECSRGSLKGEKGEGVKKEECAVNPVPCSG